MNRVQFFFKTLLLVAMLVPSLFSMAQEKENSQKRAFRLGNIESTQWMWLRDGNFSPLGLEYQSAYNDKGIFLGSVSMLLLPGETASIGITDEISFGYFNIDKAKMNADLLLNAVGLKIWSNNWTKNGKYFLNQATSVCYLTYSNTYLPWNSEMSRGTVRADGVQFGLDTTIGIMMTKTMGIGLNLGVRWMNFFKWKGDKRFINDNSYIGGTFGKKTNTCFLPTVGLSLLFM